MNAWFQMDDYGLILDVLRSVPWERAPEVTPIEPAGHEALSFFPGQQGFVGPSFPIGGLMLVANNYDNLEGWQSYRNNLSAIDSTVSLVRLTDYVIEESEVPLEQCWLTNYSLGVMDKKDSQHKFPAAIRKALKLDQTFEEFVGIMRPRLIVALGSFVAACIKAKREPTMRGQAMIMSIDHPGRWHKGPEHFRAEGRRIREAWRTGL